MVPAAIGWSDLGSLVGAARLPWRRAEPRHRRASRSRRPGHRRRQPRRARAGRGGRLVALVGLEGIIVVDTPDALLVAPADAAQDVKQVVERLRAEGLGPTCSRRSRGALGVPGGLAEAAAAVEPA